jgi:hypothetical protein
MPSGEAMQEQIQAAISGLGPAEMKDLREGGKAVDQVIKPLPHHAHAANVRPDPASLLLEILTVDCI